MKNLRDLTARAPAFGTWSQIADAEVIDMLAAAGFAFTVIDAEHGVRATAISPGFVDTPMTDWNPVPKDEMIRPEDCAEIVRLLLKLSPYARIPHVVVERVGS